jgi:hypothetical protein
VNAESVIAKKRFGKIAGVKEMVSLVAPNPRDMHLPPQGESKLTQAPLKQHFALEIVCA